jgi:hypothetical protein
MRNKMIYHGIAVIGIAIFIFLSVASANAPEPSNRVQNQSEQELAMQAEQERARQEVELVRQEQERERQERARQAEQERLAQAQELIFGTEISKNLGAGEEHWFRYHATESRRIVVYTSGSTDTYLEFYSANNINNQIAYDDNGGEGRNARLVISVVAENTYLFKLRGASSSTNGAYRIILLDEAAEAEAKRRALANFIIVPSNFDPAKYTRRDLFNAVSASRNLTIVYNKWEVFTQWAAYFYGVSDLTFVRQNGTEITFTTDDNAITQTMTIDQRSGLQPGQRVRVYYFVTRSPLTTWDVEAIERR